MLLLLLWLLLPISFLCLCGLCIALQCAFLWGAMKARSFWHFQATSAPWRFKECKTFLGTSATAWVCTDWARHRQLRPGCRMAWGGTRCLDPGRWAGHVGAVPISIPWKAPVVFDTQSESFGHQGRLWSFQAPTQVCPAYLHLPVMWSLCWAGEGREGFKLSVKDKAIPALWLSWFISGAVW